jgi:cation:H+ antiporter
VSTLASLRGEADIAIGNVVGSNIFNVLLILGVSALVAPLLVSRQLTREQVPVMIGVSGLLWVLVVDGAVRRLEGALLLGGIVAYTSVLIVRGRAENRAGGEDRSVSAVSPALAGVAVVAGLALLVVGSRWLVEAARSMALALGISDLVVALTVVAAGTSLPELATSVVASLRGERDIAVGNLVGSNVFNVLAILGASALVAPAGLAVAPAALSFDVPVMVAVAVACFPVFLGGRIERWQGGVFVSYYAAYVTYLVLDTSGHQALPEFRAAMLWFFLPLTGFTLVLAGWRGMRRRRRRG